MKIDHRVFYVDAANKILKVVMLVSRSVSLFLSVIMCSMNYERKNVDAHPLYSLLKGSQL